MLLLTSRNKSKTWLQQSDQSQLQNQQPTSKPIIKNLHSDATIVTSLVILHQIVLHHLETEIHDSTNIRKEEMSGKTINEMVLTMVESIEMLYHQIVQIYLDKTLTISDQIINETSITTMMAIYMTVGIETFT